MWPLEINFRRAAGNFLKEGLGVQPQFYASGDKPKLPPALVKAGLTAEILGPPPTGDTDFLKLMDLKKGVGQYLGEENDGSGELFDPGFGPQCCVDDTSYPASAFREWTRANQKAPCRQMQRSPCFWASQSVSDRVSRGPISSAAQRVIPDRRGRPARVRHRPLWHRDCSWAARCMTSIVHSRFFAAIRYKVFCRTATTFSSTRRC